MILDEPTLLIALGDCVACGVLFGFDPDLVPSIRICPTTRQPQHACPCPDRTACFAGSLREPICRPCILRANQTRQKHGLAPWPVIGYV